MSEPTIAAVEAVAAPLIKDAEQALAPEAVKVLGDLKAFVGGEADKLRTELPTLVGTAMEHIHSIGTSMLERYQAVMDHIDAHLASATPDPDPSAPATPSAPVAQDPTPAPSTTPEASSAPSSTPSTSDTTTPAPESPTAPTA